MTHATAYHDALAAGWDNGAAQWIADLATGNTTLTAEQVREELAAYGVDKSAGRCEEVPE